MSKQSPLSRDDFFFFTDIDTRWMDNDVYGHVNNVVYYSYFDSIVNRYLINNHVLDIKRSEIIGLMVKSECYFHSSVAFPEALEGGFSLKRIGNSSVEYQLGIFKKGSDHTTAHGFMTHVFVERKVQKPKKIEGDLRLALERALVK